MGLVPTGLVKSLVNKYLADGSITSAITYKKNTTSYNKTTAVNSITSTEYAMKTLHPITYKKEETTENGTKYVMFKRFFIRIKYFEDNDLTPTLGDYINYNSKDWEVLEIEPIEIGDVGLMYEFNCKKG